MSSSGNVPIVQGQYVSSGTNYSRIQDPAPVAASSPYQGTGEAVTATAYAMKQDGGPMNTAYPEQHHREPPRKQYQDLIFAVAFWVHLVIVGIVIFFNLGGASNQQQASSGFQGKIVSLTVASGLTSVGLSTFSLYFMMKHTESLVQTALIFSVCTSLAIGILGFLSGSIFMGVLGMLSFCVGCWYAKVVWPRIPYAAANLQTALTAVQSNLGMAVVSYAFTAIAFVWSIFWFVGCGNALEGQNLFVVFLLFLSYYWVHQVLQNTVHVTVAGTVGTWWFVPSEASSFWSTALSDSLYRASTYSFGSICFGSLLVAIIQALRALEHYARSSDDYKFLVCIIQCILACIQSIIEYFNRYAYTMIGLYGFSYLEAGRNVLQLFREKGWTVIITDDLTDNVLFLVSVVIGLLSGVVGLTFGLADPDMFYELGFSQAAGPAFGAGFLAGFLFSSILMSVVSSAICTVIVCFAEAPSEFQMNHPELSSRMHAAWTEAWPGVYN